ncbi:HD domain-containing protein [Nodosilinea sp. LEGE 07088]|uniref:HD domain-containing protein n=1 Tax=Nodosilinea sp. LEGE 07088 TaxID=2777968 RepID=UPI00187FD5F1|nr:HD domain-containing protein [Nodosilinea sp. LEGE 07088]MBE9136091.1 HD domain-containing protein [Nodosilinea sp. LEGE 07088]
MHIKASRSYHDPLHGAITLHASDPDEALLTQLIDTPAFQRLRRIRQLGPASLTFHGAESSRFTHSLGVMAIARRAFDQLQRRYPELAPHRATVLVAALLHDIGHGPFSHTAEEVFGLQHEQWTRRIIQDLPAIYDALESRARGLATAVDQVYTHEHPIALVWQLVSSQLDCDRLDYLLRDSYFTGASYGQLDLDRILMALRFEPHSGRLVVAHKGLAAIEHYLVVRHFMYAQVYNHAKNISVTWLLERAFERARSDLLLGKLEADPTVTAWLLAPDRPLSLETYLAGDDIIFTYHLQRWRHSPDPLLADLCRRFLDRDLLKTLEVTRLTPDLQQALLTTVQHHLASQGYSSEQYSGLRRTWSRGYTTYNQGIDLHIDNAFVDIKDLSPLVQTLSQPYERTWLLYPREIYPWLQQTWATYGAQVEPQPG